MKKIIILSLTGLLFISPALAESVPSVNIENKPGVEVLDEAPAAKSDVVEYHNDPIYVPLGGADNHPMLDLFNLAEDDDPRAQYILADLYSKGKGGIGKNTKLAKMLFERSAKLGNADAFTRLAAIAKHEDNKIEAYKWYSLGINRLKQGSAIKWARDQRTALDLNRADRNKAEDAMRTWERTKLEPLNLHTPLNPLKKEKTEPEKEKAEEKNSEDVKVETETETETETKTEEDNTDEQD